MHLNLSPDNILLTVDGKYKVSSWSWKDFRTFPHCPICVFAALRGRHRFRTQALRQLASAVSEPFILRARTCVPPTPGLLPKRCILLGPHFDWSSKILDFCNEGSDFPSNFLGLVILDELWMFASLHKEEFILSGYLGSKFEITAWKDAA